MFLDEIGIYYFKDINFTPTYNCYKKDDKFIIRIEAPGNSSIITNIKYIEGYQIIRINGCKKTDKEPNNFENIFNTRKFGNFSIEIPLQIEEYLIKNENPSLYYKLGIFIVEFQLDKKRMNEAEFNLNEEDNI